MAGEQSLLVVRIEAILILVFLGRGELCDRHDESKGNGLTT